MSKAFDQQRLRDSEQVFQAVTKCEMEAWDEVCQADGILPCVAPIPVNLMADAFGIMESRGLLPNQIRMNPLDFADFRKWPSDSPFEARDDFVPNIEGPRGTLWGAYVITDLSVPARWIYVLAPMSPVDLNPNGLVLIQVCR